MEDRLFPTMIYVGSKVSQFVWLPEIGKMAKSGKGFPLIYLAYLIAVWILIF